MCISQGFSRCSALTNVSLKYYLVNVAFSFYTTLMLFVPTTFHWNSPRLAYMHIMYFTLQTILSLINTCVTDNVELMFISLCLFCSGCFQVGMIVFIYLKIELIVYRSKKGNDRCKKNRLFYLKTKYQFLFFIRRLVSLSKVERFRFWTVLNDRQQPYFR